jgi:hypothetical protein
MTADMEECPYRTVTSSASSDTPLIVQVLHDAQVILNEAFERQQGEQKLLPYPSNKAAAEHEEGQSPLAVTPTILLQSEAEEWARLLMRSRDMHRGEPDDETSTRNNHAKVHLLYQDFTALCQNASE